MKIKIKNTCGGKKRGCGYITVMPHYGIDKKVPKKIKIGNVKHRLAA